MSCFHPASAVRLQNGDVKFVSASTVDGTSMKLPCGQCIGCRLEYSRQWAIRCLDEAAMHSSNCFITLTNSEESVSKFGRSLDVSVFQNFMKRFRKEVAPLRIRFFIVVSTLSLSCLIIMLSFLVTRFLIGNFLR